jgi:hypothetical protein
MLQANIVVRLPFGLEPAKMLKNRFNALHLESVDWSQEYGESKLVQLEETIVTDENNDVSILYAQKALRENIYRVEILAFKPDLEFFLVKEKFSGNQYRVVLSSKLEQSLRKFVREQHFASEQELIGHHLRVQNNSPSLPSWELEFNAKAGIPKNPSEEELADGD